MSAPDEEARKQRRGMNFRAEHRARSHESAHAEAQEHPAYEPDIKHALVPPRQAPLINSQEDLKSFVEHLRSVGQFAYDSEFIGELTYLPKLCLIQCATSTRIALIDPLAKIDLKPFWELICDPSIEKIVHAGQQDVEPVVRHLGCRASNLFDTQIVAGFAGMSYPVSLSKLVGELVGARLGKGMTFSHWDQRPLTAVQLRYAADDVRYLPALRAELAKRVQTLGHWEYARQECEAMAEPTLYQFDPQTQFMRVRGATSLSSQGLAILKELTILRDAAAREADIPPRAFMRDEVMIDLARSPVKSAEKLGRVRGLPRPVQESHGQEILEATRRGLSALPANFPVIRPPEESPSDRFRADALWAACQVLCAGHAIDPNLVSSRQEVGELYRKMNAGKDVSNLRVMKGWRGELAGKAVIKLARGESNLRVSWEGEAPRARVE